MSSHRGYPNVATEGVRIGRSPWTAVTAEERCPLTKGGETALTLTNMVNAAVRLSDMVNRIGPRR